MPREREISVTPDTYVPDCLSRREEIARNNDWKNSYSFFFTFALLSRFNFSLFVDNHILTLSKQFFKLSKAWATFLCVR